MIALIYLTGARIGEMRLLRRKHVHLSQINEEISFVLPTFKKKRQIGKDEYGKKIFKKIRKKRNVILGLHDPFMKDLIIPFMLKPSHPNTRYWKKTKRSYQLYLGHLNKAIHGDNKKKYLTFHYLRHSAITHVARDLKASPYEVAALTGQNPASYEEYLIYDSPARFKNRMSHG